MFTAVQGKGEVFTYFLVGEDSIQRMRRMSVDKPELFVTDNNNRGALTPVAPHDSYESLCSNGLLTQNDTNQLPTVIVTNTEMTSFDVAAQGTISPLGVVSS
jgi:hypothetical protein